MKKTVLMLLAAALILTACSPGSPTPAKPLPTEEGKAVGSTAPVVATRTPAITPSPTLAVYSEEVLKVKAYIEKHPEEFQSSLQFSMQELMYFGDLFTYVEFSAYFPSLNGKKFSLYLKDNRDEIQEGRISFTIVFSEPVPIAIEGAGNKNSYLHGLWNIPYGKVAWLSDAYFIHAKQENDIQKTTCFAGEYIMSVPEWNAEKPQYTGVPIELWQAMEKDAAHSINTYVHIPQYGEEWDFPKGTYTVYFPPINPWTYSLPMYALDEKGTTLYRGSVVIPDINHEDFGGSFFERFIKGEHSEVWEEFERIKGYTGHIFIYTKTNGD